MEEKLQFAVLIDAENVSAKYASVIFDELEKYGFASCRRIYGNWSKEMGWKEETLLAYSIIPIQQFSYTAGKNSTDIAMVIDAMDLLYQNKVDGFCLVTSDSDFTRLAMRLREEKKYVLGMGESKAPLALTRACNKFIHLNLINASDKENEHKEIQEDNNENNVTSIDELENAMAMLLNESGDGNAGLGFIGQRLGEKYPDFDVRNYGYSKLSVFIEEKLPHFKVIRRENQYYLSKPEKISRDRIEQKVLRILRENNGMIDNLSVIQNELTKRFAGFDLKDYGYSRLSGFLRNIEGVVVDGNKIILKNEKRLK